MIAAGIHVIKIKFTGGCRYPHMAHTTHGTTKGLDISRTEAVEVRWQKSILTFIFTMTIGYF